VAITHRCRFAGYGKFDRAAKATALVSFLATHDFSPFFSIVLNNQPKALLNFLPFK